MKEMLDFFSPKGPLAEVIDGYRPRAAQLEMASAVAEHIELRAPLVIEAGTGTGKTLAYLVPILVREGTAIVSTGTKSLQDQLFARDIPLVLRAMGVQRRVALLKGRANYVCPYRLELNAEEGRFLTRETALHFQAVKRWAARTTTGDIAELREIPEDAAVWPWVTSTVDNCLGQDCSFYRDCPLMKARQTAGEADLVVINHHLFFADAALRQEGVADLLPEADAVVFDEAHQLPEVAAAFFGQSLGSRQLTELCGDTVVEASSVAADIKGLVALTDAVNKAAADLRIALGDEGRRSPWHEVSGKIEVRQACDDLREGMALLAAHLKTLEKASRGMESCASRAERHLAIFRELCDANDANSVYWFENFKRTFVMHATPLNVADAFAQRRALEKSAWIFTSATLSVAGDFSHFIGRMGLEESSTRCLSSPFDFRRQAVFYLPENLPMPDDSGYTAALVDAMVPVITAARGRTFFLFTSHRALREAAALLADRLEFPLLVQGQAGRRQLLDEFREKGNAVLLGAASFWEGIDVRGDALSCVIIDRLPFASPADPVAAARIEHMRQEGGQPFREYQLPQAVLALRQGVGRLIRDVSDRGLLVVGDQRLLRKSYGKLFLESLPDMTKTRKLEVVQRFFRMLEEEAEAR